MFVICVIAVLLNLYFVYQIQEFVDVVTAGIALSMVWKSFLQIIVIGFAALFMGIVQNRMWHVFRYILMNQIQTMMYKKLLMKKAIFYDIHTTGEIVSAVMNDGTLIAETAGISILMFFLNSMQIIVILGVLIWKNTLLGVIAFLFQEPVILEGSLRENIALDDPFTDKEIERVLKFVLLDEFACEHGLDYAVNESGKNLSGGQKQRLALARVLIRKPKILILDEATNGLDETTEKLLLNNILEYIESTQSILIATSHKPAIQRICNRRLEL